MQYERLAERQLPAVREKEHWLVGDPADRTFNVCSGSPGLEPASGHPKRRPSCSYEHLVWRRTGPPLPRHRYRACARQGRARSNGPGTPVPAVNCVVEPPARARAVRRIAPQVPPESSRRTLPGASSPRLESPPHAVAVARSNRQHSPHTPIAVCPLSSRQHSSRSAGSLTPSGPSLGGPLLCLKSQRNAPQASILPGRAPPSLHPSCQASPQ
jgi:hypothetical protein